MYFKNAIYFCNGKAEFFIFVGEMEQKQAIWCLNRKSLNINLLFIELLYKINITIMLIFEQKTALFV